MSILAALLVFVSCNTNAVTVGSVSADVGSSYLTTATNAVPAVFKVVAGVTNNAVAPYPAGKAIELPAHAGILLSFEPSSVSNAVISMAVSRRSSGAPKAFALLAWTVDCGARFIDVATVTSLSWTTVKWQECARLEYTADRCLSDLLAEGGFLQICPLNWTSSNALWRVDNLRIEGDLP